MTRFNQAWRSENTLYFLSNPSILQGILTSLSRAWLHEKTVEFRHKQVMLKEADKFWPSMATTAAADDDDGDDGRKEI